MVGVELVEDRDARRPYPRAARVTEAVVRGARDAGVLVYSGTGNADGIDGDRSCWDRRSSSPTTSWNGSPTSWQHPSRPRSRQSP